MLNREQAHSIEAKVESLNESEIEALRPVLIEHVRDRDTNEILWGEIADIEAYMRGEKDKEGRTRTYLVAKNELTGEALGCMAYSTPDTDMLNHFNATPDESAELLNAFVASKFQGQGIGKKLFGRVCEATRQQGKKLLLINSGPRYQKSWGFYDKVCDESCGFIKEKYGSGSDAKTWKKKL